MWPRGPRLDRRESVIVRLEFAKRGPVRFISHRDVARVWERGFRRARLPLAFSQGFSPHPKVSFGLALPLGYESVAEYLDVTLVERVPVSDVKNRLAEVLPDGMTVQRAAEVAAGAVAIASAVQWADYVVELDLGAAPCFSVHLEGYSPIKCTQFGEAPSGGRIVEGALRSLSEMPVWRAPRRRKGREVPDESEDLRPFVDSVHLHPGSSGNVALWMRLATQPRVVRPEEICVLLSACATSGPVEARLVRRVAQIFIVDGCPADPLGGAPAVSISPPIGRASPGEKECSLIHAKIPSST